MKQKYFLRIIILFIIPLMSSNSITAQVSENFDNWSDSSYGTTNSYGEWVSNKALTGERKELVNFCLRGLLEE